MSKLVRIVLSILPLLVLLVLTPYVSAVYFMSVSDIRWQVGFLTVWIWGSLWIGTLIHAKVVTKELGG